MMMLAMLLLLLAPAGAADEAYVAAIAKQRQERDDSFRSRQWSPLAVVAIAALDRPVTIVGSGPGSDLRLVAEGVADKHAEILRQIDVKGRPMFRVHALDGKIWTETDPSRQITELPISEGLRMKMGPRIVYIDRLGSFGWVVRALDFDSPAFTKFDGLRYFPTDPAYRVEAIVTPYAKAEPVTIADTHGWQRPAWRYGEAAFTLGGKQLRLVLLLWTDKPGPKDLFFIAFTDETRGTETYPAARYLEVPFAESGTIVLDFNLATNPLCAYNAGFACPLPPRENRLPIPVRAGEKIYPHAAGHD